METVKNAIIIMALATAYLYCSNMDYDDAVMAHQAQQSK